MAVLKWIVCLRAGSDKSLCCWQGLSWTGCRRLAFGHGWVSAYDDVHGFDMCSHGMKFTHAYLIHLKSGPIKRFY